MRPLLKRGMIWCVPVAILAATAAAWIVLRPSPPSPPPIPELVGPIQLRNITDHTGIDFRHTDGSGGQPIHRGDGGLRRGHVRLRRRRADRHLLPQRPAAAGHAGPGPPPKNRLYRNLGGFRFQDVTDQAGVGDTGYGLGVCVGDYNNDGCPDIYVANFGPKVLYRNNGDGTFTDVTRRGRRRRREQVGAGAAFWTWTATGTWTCTWPTTSTSRTRSTCPKSPTAFPSTRGRRATSRSRQPCSATTATARSPTSPSSPESRRHPGPGMGMVCRRLRRRRPHRHLRAERRVRQLLLAQRREGAVSRRSALANGLKYNGDGVPMGSMGVDCADYDHDGRLDFFQTCYQGEPPVLVPQPGRRDLRGRDAADRGRRRRTRTTSNGAAASPTSTTTATRTSSTSTAISRTTWNCTTARPLVRGRPCC